MTMPFAFATRRLVLGGMAAAAGAGFRQAPPPSQPPAAYSVGLAMNEAAGELLLFGGSRGRGAYAGDTWRRRPEGPWSRLEGPGPDPRNGPEMVYDHTGRRVLLFGGDTNAHGHYGDVWAHDGAAWTRVSDDGPARGLGGVVWHQGLRRLWAFGGVAGDQALGDLWLWDGRRWEQASGAGPSARFLAGAAYDSHGDRVVLFGGSSAPRQDAPLSGETWIWKAGVWTLSSQDAGPGPRDHLAMAYDPERRAVVLHGGGDEAQAAETWLWSDGVWSRLLGDGPTLRFARMVFDPASRRMLMYGGFNRQGPSNRLWRLERDRWTEVA